MISKKYFIADGVTPYFLTEFIIKGSEYCRVYIHDALELPVSSVARQALLAPVSDWELFNNNIVFYDATKPAAGKYVTIWVASTPEELDTFVDYSFLTYDNLDDVQTVANNIDDVKATASNSSDITDIANNMTAVLAASTHAATASTKATEAATSATEAATSATEAATSAASVLTSETNAATSETNAATSATNASTSETNASTSETSASASASSASTSASTATTKATEAATSATNAAASEVAAETAETNAETAETNAASSATAAAASATAAATAETNAAASATAAANSAAQLTNVYTRTEADALLADKVDDTQVLTNVPANAVFTDTVYTHPTGDGNLHVPATSTNNDGKILTAGSTAGSISWQDAPVSLPAQSTHDGKFLTTDGTAASWADVDALPDQTGNNGKFLTTDGSAASWVDNDTTVSKVTYEYTATAGQTTFSGADNNGLTLAYTSGNTLVTYGGFDLPFSDFTATNGTSVVLTDGAEAGKIVRIIAFETFDVANTYTQAETDAGFVAKDSSGNVGIGTSSPSAKLDVKSAQGAVGFNYGTSPSPERGNLWYDTDGTGWKFNIGKVQSGSFTSQVTLQDNGNVGIGTSSPRSPLEVNGDIELAGGIFLGGSRSAANNLDDYETGTWTPTFVGAIILDSVGTYTKVGNLVHFQARVQWTNGTGTRLFGGLPFTCSSGNESHYSMTITPYVNEGFGGIPSGKGWANGYVNSGGTGISWTWQPISSPVVTTATGNVYFQGSYIAA